MPSILSKILMPEWNVPYNCYELGHTWTPFCTEAALEIGWIVFNQSLKLYAPLYLGNQVLQKKIDRKSLIECLRSIVRSSVFLGINAFFVILFFCWSRQILGRFYYSLCAYMPSFFGSLLAILNERPSRQKALAFYVANISSETFFRILLSRGYIREIPNGLFYLFSIATSLLLCLYEMDLLQDPLIKFAFRMLIGSSNKLGKDDNDVDIDERMDIKTSIKTPMGVWYNVQNGFEKIWLKLKNIFPILNSRHRTCVHYWKYSCFEYIVFQSLIKSFFLGWCSQLIWKSISKLLSGRFNDALIIFTREQMFSSQYTSFALFLSTFSTIYNSLRCILCHWTQTQNPWHSVLASLFASPAFLLAPDTSMTLYLVWKCIEALFNVATRKGFIRYDKLIIPLIYATASSQLFYAAILDPSHMKPSYKRFIDKVTENRLKYINRNVLEVFGTNASKGYESFYPIYDLKHTTRRFQESVLIWLL